MERLWPYAIVVTGLALLHGVVAYTQFSDTQTASGVISAAAVLEATPTATPTPCPPDGCPVGGIVELANLAGMPVEAEGSSGPNASVVAGVVVAVTAGAVALAGAAWYARRPRTR